MADALLAAQPDQGQTALTHDLTRWSGHAASPVRLPVHVGEWRIPLSQLQVELVAADRKVWEGEAKQVSVRTVEGEMGILPGHTPLLGILVSGEVRIESTSGQTHTATIDSGFLSVEHDRVTIVAEAVDASQINT